MWGGWVEFIYMSYAASLGVPPLIEDGVVVTKPEYLIMPTALPFAVLTFIMMIYGGDTRWGIVSLIRRMLNIRTESRGANPGIWSLVELVLLIWYAYLALLLMYDKDILGDRHPATLIFAFICLAVAITLFVKQLRTRSWESGIRQSIVTVCILWTWVEVMIRLKFFTEIWIHPAEYAVEMILLLVAFVAVSLFLLRKKDKYADN